ncbi:hypothetical protein LEP1GSC039_3660 [Leptospira santarosai str. 2000027870]|nr:hypothetical protein LEP1GSC039_3660 [Leptospira santarosai str. 2000027870]
MVGQDEVILYQLQGSSVKRLILKSHNTIFEPEVIVMLDKNRIVVADRNEDPDEGFALHWIVYSDKKINTSVRLFPKKGIVAWQYFQNRFYFVLLSKAKNKNNYSFAIWQPDEFYKRIPTSHSRLRRTFCKRSMRCVYGKAKGLSL